MGKRIVVVAPHADDEVIGCGGMILKEIDAGSSISWVLMTGVSADTGYSSEFTEQRANQIQSIKDFFGIQQFFNLGYKPASLEMLDKADVIEKLANIIKKLQPTDLFVPYPGDAHSDHNFTFKCTKAFIKPFRYEYLKRVYCYETISETDQNFTPDSHYFKPNSFVNISQYIDRKIKAALIYETEFKAHPFPRSVENIRALALHRGASSNYNYAEAFMMLLNRQD